VKQVLVDLPALPGYNESLLRLGDEIKILQRVSIDEDEIGISTFENDAEWALAAGTPRPGESK
jgi:hypothetical protein